MKILYEKDANQELKIKKLQFSALVVKGMLML